MYMTLVRLSQKTNYYHLIQANSKFREDFYANGVGAEKPYAFR